MKLLLLTSIISLGGYSSTHQLNDKMHQHDSLCQGFFPKSEELKHTIPAQGYTNDGLSEREFNEINENAERVFSKFAKKYNGNLKVVGEWQNERINGHAYKDGSDWNAVIFGGFARAKGMTKDAYSVIVCHELGHLLAGFPITPRGFQPRNIKTEYASEGSADFYATHSCFVELYKDDFQGNLNAEQNASEFVKQTCNEAHTDRTRQQICMRGMIAGHRLWQSFYDTVRRNKTLSLKNKDPYVIYKTTSGHPDTQCRVDTHVAGATCNKPSYADNTYPLTAKEMNEVTCSAKEYGQNHYKGVKPLCWFNPNNLETEPNYLADQQFAGTWVSPSCKNDKGSEDLSERNVIEFSRTFDQKGIVSFYKYYYYQRDCRGEKKVAYAQGTSGTYEFGPFDVNTQTRDLKIFRERINKYRNVYTKITWKRLNSDKIGIFIAKPTKDANGTTPSKRAHQFSDEPDGVIE